MVGLCGTTSLTYYIGSLVISAIVKLLRDCLSTHSGPSRHFVDRLLRVELGRSLDPESRLEPGRDLLSRRGLFTSQAGTSLLQRTTIDLLR
jgi:hypothetical protein